ncbi:DUF4185 domain-containing protein [Mycobacterium sp. MYCO198283]|uniref:DUF4185 domain-containing protein n=1 Tax=Mycobacterium sp. MYCO198283 TaxID=2883505 RepID=UPI001E5037B4|nr:DUF4185 domain-containing protein [Mycobacterium sp. MYCO198283]MCG5432873.1 DUF4185 domain-containing protein [Mycobacterium sp. MYCO198283]
MSALVALAPVAQATPPLAAGEVYRVGPVAGTGTPTRDYGIGATDLCEFMEFPSQLLQVCGDSFAGQGVGFGGWFTPIALHVDMASVDDPQYFGITGIREPLLADSAPPGASQLPAGVVQINRENYLLVTTTESLVPRSSRLVKASPTQANWPTIPGSVRNASYDDGAQTQVSGFYDPIPTPDSPTGWVFVVANSFDRTRPVRLYRVPPQRFTDRDAWQGFGGGMWGGEPAPLWPDRVGEMSFQQIDGKAVLSYFNATTGDIEVRVANSPVDLGTAPVTTVVRHSDWPDPADVLPEPFDNRLAQPYGGYISPASTLDELRIFVSQWNTLPRSHAPYRVIQFAVRPFVQ